MADESQVTPPPQGKSKLPAFGCLLMVGGPVAATGVAKLLATAPEGRRLPLALLTDGLRLAFFVGLALLVIGLLRNRRRARQARAVRPPENERGS